MSWWQNVISLACDLVRRWLGKADAAKEAEKPDPLDKAAADVANKDADAVNRRTEALRRRMRAPLVAALALCLFTAGCVSRGKKGGIVVIESDRVVYPMVSTNGVSGWFVPDATMRLYQIAAQYYLDNDNTEKK